MSRRAADMTGQRFGRLVVLRRAPAKPGVRAAIWSCECDCGKRRDIMGSSLRLGLTKSCGCIRIETLQNPERRSAMSRKASAAHERKRRLVDVGLEEWPTWHGDKPAREVEYKSWVGAAEAARDLEAALGMGWR